jgi:hypothetical protein
VFVGGLNADAVMWIAPALSLECSCNAWSLMAVMDTTCRRTT